MSIPSQAEKQGAEAEALMEKLYGSKPEGDKPEGTPAAPTEAAPTQAAPNTPEDENSDTWKQRYFVLKGKEYAEVPRLSGENKALREKVAALEKQIADSTQYATPEETAHYGPEFLSLVERAAEKKTAPLMAKLATLEANDTNQFQTQAAKAEAEMFDDLSKAHADWETVNADPKWLRFLSALDPSTRVQRQQLLNAALANFDAQYVIDLMDQWKALNRASPAPVAESAPAAPVKPQASPEPETVRGNAPAAPGPKVYTTSQVTKFYKDWRDGKFTDEQAAKIEQDIDLAGTEGRIKRG